MWNYAEPGAGGSPREFEIQLTRTGTADVTVVDEQHGSPVAAWRTMGEPAFPSREQQKVLRDAARMPSARQMPIRDGSLKLRLEPHALALIELAP